MFIVQTKPRQNQEDVSGILGIEVQSKATSHTQNKQTLLATTQQVWL